MFKLHFAAVSLRLHYIMPVCLKKQVPQMLHQQKRVNVIHVMVFGLNVWMYIPVASGDFFNRVCGVLRLRVIFGSRDLAATAHFSTWPSASRTAYLAHEITRIPANHWEHATNLMSHRNRAEVPKLRRIRSPGSFRHWCRFSENYSCFQINNFTYLFPTFY